MGNKNYTKYSEKSDNEPVITNVDPEVITNENVDNETVTELEKDVTNVDPEVPEIEDTKNNTVKTVEATVVNCPRLNVRKEPNKDADVIRIFNKGDMVVVDLENSTNDFYKVLTPSGEGYCMKQYIEIVEE